MKYMVDIVGNFIKGTITNLYLMTYGFIGICDPNPCGEGAICDSSTGNALCSCPKGRTGDPLLRCGKFFPKWNEMMFCSFTVSNINILYCIVFILKSDPNDVFLFTS